MFGPYVRFFPKAVRILIHIMSLKKKKHLKIHIFHFSIPITPRGLGWLMNSPTCVRCCLLFVQGMYGLNHLPLSPGTCLKIWYIVANRTNTTAPRLLCADFYFAASSSHVFINGNHISPPRPLPSKTRRENSTALYLVDGIHPFPPALAKPVFECTNLLQTTSARWCPNLQKTAFHLECPSKTHHIPTTLVYM